VRDARGELGGELEALRLSAGERFDPWPIERYPTPSSVSVARGREIFWNGAKTFAASSAESFRTSPMERPAHFTSRVEGSKRAPWQVSHGVTTSGRNAISATIAP